MTLGDRRWESMRAACAAAARATKKLDEAVKESKGMAGAWAVLELRAIAHRQAAVALEIERYLKEAENG